ncbi:IS630 transposase-related protein [Nostoc sp.]|uniref:IS630 transposase-related protein n=1 Tax=Nostoc sp. TaxID=1180 RepID=UPI002FF6E28F
MHFTQVEMKAYSLDLRQKIIDTYFEGGISQRQLAKRFRVALSFVEKLLKQYREVGNIAAKVRIQQTPTKLNAQQLSILKQTVEANKDATLDLSGNENFIWLKPSSGEGFRGSCFI